MSDSAEWLRGFSRCLTPECKERSRVLAIADELDAAQKTIQSLRADLDNPPGDVQEKVIQMLGMEATQRDARRFLRMAELDFTEMYSNYWDDGETLPDDLREAIDAALKP